MLISDKEVDEPLLQVNLIIVSSVCKCTDHFECLDGYLQQWFCRLSLILQSVLSLIMFNPGERGLWTLKCLSQYHPGDIFFMCALG